jgi:hypothetical protein
METGARQALYVIPPRAAEQGLYSTSTTAATQDLRLLGPQTATTDSNVNRGDVGAPGRYVTVTAITADCYVCFDKTAALVGSITATTTGTNQANTSKPVFAGTSRDFRLEPGRDLFMGYVTASGTGYVHVDISSNR